MKKVLSLLVAAIILVTMTGTAFAASGLELTYHIYCDDYETVPANDVNNYRIEVPSGTVITVDFLIEADSEFSLSTFQNEIYFDPDFFSLMTGSGKVVKEGSRCGLKTYSDGEMRVFVNTVTDTTMEANQKVASFELLVKEDTVGAESLIETKLPKASDQDGEILVINEKNLEVQIIAGDPAVKKYNLTYLDENNSVIDKIEGIVKGQAITLAEPEIEKDGFVFDGWKIDGQVKKPGEKITVDSDIEAVAVWKAKVEYLLHFDTNGGSSIPSVKGYKGDTISLTQKPTRSGYAFGGWYSDLALTIYVSSITLNSDTTVYAKWNSDGGGGGGGGGGGATQKHTITFKTTDGIELESIEKSSGSVVDLSKYKYHKEGYTFEGWYTDKDLANKVTSIKLMENISLYANWTVGVNSGYHPEILTTEHYAYIMGRDGSLICPQENITRAEVATIFFRLLTEEVRKESLTKENTFSDVATSEWYNTAVSTLTKLEVLKGRTESSFEPDAYITRAEFTTIAARFSDGVYVGEDYFVDIDGHWAQKYINIAANLGWIIGENGIFRPDDNITRAEVMTLVNRVLNRIPESEKDLLDDMIKWDDNADASAWYYLAVQEATNSHKYIRKEDGVHERWTDLTENPNWAEFEK